MIVDTDPASSVSYGGTSCLVFSCLVFFFFQNDPEATAKFQMVGEAYMSLTTPHYYSSGELVEPKVVSEWALRATACWSAVM